MKGKLFLIAALISAFTMLPARAGTVETDRVTLETLVKPADAKRGETVVWRLIAKIKPDCYSYPTEQVNPEAEQSIVKFRAPSYGPFVFVGKVVDPAFTEKTKLGIRLNVVEGEAIWEWRFIVHPEAKPGKHTIELDRSNFQVCNSNSCVPVPLPSTEITISDAAPVVVDKAYSADVEKFPLADPKTKAPAGPPNPPLRGGPENPNIQEPGVVPPATTLEEHGANLRAVRAQLEQFDKPVAIGAGGLWGFIGTAIFWGAVALITPCVFPMIPITVSFFLKQSESEHHRPIRMATIYCGTIVIVLGIAALTVLTTFQTLSVHWATNIVLGGLFVFFALSLFGMYEIVLPSSWVAFTSQREGRGGAVGTIFMALTFTIVSFTCVAPFLGGFGGMAKSGMPMWQRALGAFAFSTTFASPFFVLALFPSLIKKLPQSGSWLNSVKVVMGFLELAAALKFFRTAELRLLPMPQYFTYDLVLGVWVAMAVVCGLYLLNSFRLHHDEPIEHIGVTRMLLGLAFLALSAYLVPAMFKQGKGESQRPGGVIYAWIDSFLLPEPSHEDLRWSVNLKGTVEAARAELVRSGKRQFIFLDNTGVTCTNCKYNERSVFTRDEVRKLLLEYRLVQHYTDEVPAQFYLERVDEDRRVDEAMKLNKTFEDDLFGTLQLPLYVAMEVTKDKILVRGVYSEGKINDVAAFTDFLRNSKK